MAAVSTVSVRSSTLMGPDAAAAGSAGYPECVLLNNTARFSDDRNATTAACRTLEGQRVSVSFWLADPPDVSRFSVHCPGISAEGGSSSDPPPFIIAAEGAFVLLCVTLDGSDHHFVYSARGNPAAGKKKRNKPSLRLLVGPTPAVEAFESQQFGLLPLGDEHYAVAFLHHKWKSRDNSYAYHAYVFSSKTNKWRRSGQALLHLSSDSDRLLLDRHASSKQITVGEASLGWVDLMRGILLFTGIFDDDRPVLTYIPLPAEKVCITDRRGYPHYAPEYFCDVVVCGGDLIKFVELDFEDPGCRDNGKSWRATTWSRKVSWDDWRKHRTVDVSEISVDPSYSALLPGLVVDDERQQELQLKKLYFLNPTLSVRDDHLLYMLAKVDERDDTAWVLALQMEHAALQALVPVSTRESRAVTMFCACLFPKYYMDNTTPDMGNPVEKENSDEFQQGRPDSNDYGGNLKKRRKKKQAHAHAQARCVDRRVEQPFLLYFMGCVLVVVIVKVFCHLF